MEEVNVYHVDSEIGNDAVRHLAPGVSVPGCQGIWHTKDRLPGENGDDVQVQCLELPQDSGCPEPLTIFRAVKRLRRQTYPMVDNSQMIERELLCMARANVSARALFDSCTRCSNLTL